MNLQEKLQRLATMIQEQQMKSLKEKKLDCEVNLKNCITKIVPGNKYIKIDIGYSGRYMIDKKTEKIYGIKGYGVIHKGYQFGNLDTIDQYNWGEYYAVKIS